MTVREFELGDISAVGKIWDECILFDKMLYLPFDREYFVGKLVENGVYERALLLVCECEGEVVGFIAGARKHSFLPNETDENTPAYLTCVMVSPAYRKRGAGSALLSELEKRFHAIGKRNIDVSSLNPIDLDWLIPNTPMHSHNNMPGIDIDSEAYKFLLARGFGDTVREVAMYLNLAEYKKSGIVEQKRAELLEKGIVAGLYDPNEGCEWDGMCDRVGSEYWRNVLKTELASEKPRPILAARTEGHIVGFTGPVDKEKSGRGWFTGICTDPNYEKLGIATVLFNDLMCQFIDVGAKFSSLFTGTENHAQRLYIKTGFRPVKQFAMMRKGL